MATAGGIVGTAGRPAPERVVPGLWLVSDPVRLPDPRRAAAVLPRGAAVLARGVAPTTLRALARLCRARGLRLLVSGDGRAALRHRAGLHLPDRVPTWGLLPFLSARRGRGGAAWALLSAAVHGRAGLARARRLRADAALVSPAFPTASHPGAPALGPSRWAALARAASRGLALRAVALGGVTRRNVRRLPRGTGWAAIGALASVGAAGRGGAAPSCDWVDTVFRGSRGTPGFRLARRVGAGR